jgi:hypothetical protein
MAGWIKIHREIIDHWLWSDDRKFKWWIDLLLMANYESNKMLIGNNLIECNRGQLIRSLDGLARRWMVTKKTVRTFLMLLQKDAMIKIENVKFCTRITICNYDKYQEVVNDQETVSKRLVNDQETPITPIKEIKKKEEGKKRNNIPENEFSGLQNTCIKIFTDWYEAKLDVKYFFQAQDAKGMQNIINYLIRAIGEKNGVPARPDEIIASWKLILDKYESWENFYQTQLKLSQISGNLANILSNIKGVRRGTTGKQRFATNPDDIAKIVELGFRSVAVSESTPG